MKNYQKTFIQKLINYYGNPSEQIVTYIQGNVTITDDEYCNNLVNYLTENCNKNFGFPDIASISKAVKAVPKTIQTKYCALKCNGCKKYYAINMTHCPYCWDKGKKVTEHSVYYREEPIVFVTYNKNITNSKIAEDNKDTLCYDCKFKENSYCKYFGNPYYRCPREDFENCDCKKCCVSNKKSYRWGN